MWKYIACMGLLMGGIGEVQAQALSLTVRCAPEELQENHLRGKYKEESVAYGLTAAGTLMEVWNSKENDTWTITLRTRNGALCVVASGRGWRNTPDILKGTKL